ncbi:hypothetical protein SK128_015026 [Halocaridina rubra]|uniref:Uncharacterized protein n=1 Tax=Halocaridina rubra TaxID=373956 RepID=A0AAN8WC05_HALRR
MTSEFSGALWSSGAAVLCQEPVVAPTLLLELWVPLNIQTSFLVTFSTGAPMFTSLDLIQEIVYNYSDNVTGYVWDIPLLYTATGDYNITGNASNALNWVEYGSYIHVVPVVTDLWVASASCLCLSWTSGFNIVIDLPAAPNPPWRANVTATYSGGTLVRK